MKASSIRLHTIFAIVYAILLWSRIAVLTGNYTIPVNPLLIEVAYVLIVIFLLLLKEGGKILKLGARTNVVIALMFFHCILWGKYFVVPSYSVYIEKQFNSQIIFVVVIALTVFALSSFRNLHEFISVSMYIMGLSLMVQLFKNFSQLNLNQVTQIMSISGRSRSNFGFGHYNTLGSACLCVIVLSVFRYTLDKKTNIINCILVFASIIMMLCSASRSSLTGTAIFALVLAAEKINNANFSKRSIQIIHMLEIVFVVIMIGFAAEIDVENFLQQSQRSHLFEVAIPQYLKTGRILTGVGYSSNSFYGNGTIFGRILWLDNSYIYYLIATGVWGLTVIVINLIFIAIPIIKSRHTDGIVFFSLLCTYLYRALFEVTLFESGYMMNYIYLPILIYFAEEHKRKRIVFSVK